jgi:hypothetical protein
MLVGLACRRTKFARRTKLFVPRMDYVKQRGAIYFIDAAAAQTLN